MALNARRFLHIGLMKSGSTSFQTKLSQLSFEKAISYSGLRPGEYKDWYSTEDEAEFFERLLRYASRRDFEEKVKELDFSLFRPTCSQSDFWVSSENLSGDAIWIERERIDKLTRVKTVYGNFTDIVVIYRPLIELIKSWFWEIQKRGILASERDFLDFLSKRLDEGFVTEQFPSRVREDLKIVFPECNYRFFRGVDEANSFLCARYPNHDIEFEEVNRSANLFSSGSVLNLWSDREKHRYLWSMKQGMDDVDLFSNLRHAKNSQSSTARDGEFELTPFIQLLNDQILSEKQSNKGRDLEGISQYFFSGI